MAEQMSEQDRVHGRPLIDLLRSQEDSLGRSSGKKFASIVRRDQAPSRSDVAAQDQVESSEKKEKRVVSD